MEQEMHKLEAELHSLVPEPMDPALMDRLLDAMGVEHESVSLDPSLRALEQQLIGLAPAPMGSALSLRLEALTREVAFPQHDKLIPFPTAQSLPQKSSKNRPAHRLAAAAAVVALAGGISALMITPKRPQGGKEMATNAAGRPVISQTLSGNQAVAAAPIVADGKFMPASYDTTIRETQDMGVRWNKRSKPMRVIKVIYSDKAEFRNGKGEKVQAEVPRVEYLMIPAKVN